MGWEALSLQPDLYGILIVLERKNSSAPFVDEI